jgi:hypothetical protein
MDEKSEPELGTIPTKTDLHIIEKTAPAQVQEAQELQAPNLPDGWVHRLWLKESRVVRGAPISFIVCMLIMLGIAIPVINWFVTTIYAARDLAKDATIQSLAQERDHYKTQAEQPPPPLADAWPALTDKQIDEWAAALAPFKIKRIWVIWGQETNATAFFRSMEKVAKKIKVEIMSNGGNAGERDILLYAEEDVANTVLGLLHDANLPAKIEGTNNMQMELSIYLPEKNP